MIGSLVVSSNSVYTVITEFGLELNLGAVELVQYLLNLSTQREVLCTCTVVDDSSFVFRVSFNSQSYDRKV